MNTAFKRSFGLACLLSAGLLLVPTTAAVDSTSDVTRVGGDLTATVTRTLGRWRSGISFIEESLPQGYPAPTPPGAIDLKHYPSARRAEFTGDGPGRSGMDNAFWPLFQHIKRRDIAMTSPVEMDLRGWDGNQASQPSEWTMSFLYRTSDLGPTGRDTSDDRVIVVDTEPVTVLSAGVRGAYGMDTTTRGMRALESWLETTDEWERAGDPRVLYYNGPYIPNRLKWAEVQIPVQRIGAATTEDAVTAPPVPDPAVKALLDALAETPDLPTPDIIADAAVPALSAAEILELAVERGAPLYNEGQVVACVAVYEVAVQSLRARSDLDISNATRSLLDHAVQITWSESTIREHAWRLRKAMDAAYMELQSP